MSVCLHMSKCTTCTTETCRGKKGTADLPTGDAEDCTVPCGYWVTKEEQVLLTVKASLQPLNISINFSQILFYIEIH